MKLCLPSPTFTTPTPLTTPLPTPPISSEAPTVTTTVLDPLPAVLQRFSNLESKFEAWTKVDHSEAIDASVQANLIYEVKNQMPKFLPKAVSDFVNPRLESMIRNVLQKNPAFPTQSSFTPAQPASRVVDKMDRSRSDHGDDQDPTAGSDQGKKKKRNGKDSDPSKDKVQTGSSSKGKT
ncbi:hypothetical protein Tco_0596230 [Tanacetum coccineum]